MYKKGVFVATSSVPKKKTVQWNRDELLVTVGAVLILVVLVGIWFGVWVGIPIVITHFVVPQFTPWGELIGTVLGFIGGLWVGLHELDALNRAFFFMDDSQS
jgi:hypothetical protein